MPDKIFLEANGSSQFKGNINELAEDILNGIENGTYEWDDDEGGYVIAIDGLRYDFPTDDDEELVSIQDALADALPEQASELGCNVSLDYEVTFGDNIIVVN